MTTPNATRSSPSALGFVLFELHSEIEALAASDDDLKHHNQMAKPVQSQPMKSATLTPLPSEGGGNCAAPRFRGIRAD